MRSRTKMIGVSLMAAVLLAVGFLGGVVVGQREGITDLDIIPVQPEQRLLPAQEPNLVRPNFFGQHLIDKEHWPTHPVGALGKGTLINWPYVEPQRDSYNWSNLDSWVAQAERHGVEMFYANNYSPEWAVADKSTCADRYGHTTCSGMPNLADWEDFIRDLATRYKGRIEVYELWNEPHATYGFSGTVSQMVTLTNSEAQIIRSVDPKAKIISPSGSAAYMDAYWAAGGTKDVDAVSLHAYVDSNHLHGPLPEGFMPENYLLGPTLDVISRYGLNDKPLWDTEGSWGSASLTEQDKADFVARWYILHAANGFSRTYWYAYDNQTYGTLWSPATGENAGADAYQGVRNWLLGATVEPPDYQGTSTYDALYTVDMTRTDGSPARAVWHTISSRTYSVPDTFKHYRDLDGTVHTIQDGTVSVGQEPILLEP